MQIQDHEFYQQWKPADDSFSMRTLREHVEAVNERDKFRQREKELTEANAAHRRTINEATMFSDPVDVALARLALETGHGFEIQAMKKADIHDEKVKSTALELRRLHNELVVRWRNLISAIAAESRQGNRNSGLGEVTNRRAWEAEARSTLGYVPADADVPVDKPAQTTGPSEREVVNERNAAIAERRHMAAQARPLFGWIS